MLPPPEASYSSVHEMLRSINAFAHSQGYVVTKRRYDLRKNTITSTAIEEVPGISQGPLRTRSIVVEHLQG